MRCVRHIIQIYSCFRSQDILSIPGLAPQPLREPTRRYEAGRASVQPPACSATPGASQPWTNGGDFLRPHAVVHEPTRVSRKCHVLKQKQRARVLSKDSDKTGFGRGEGGGQRAAPWPVWYNSKGQTPADPVLAPRTTRFWKANCWLWVTNNTLVSLQIVKTKWLRPKNNSELLNVLHAYSPTSCECAHSFFFFFTKAARKWEESGFRDPYS